MVGTGQQTDKLIDSAKRQNEAAESFSKSASRISDRIDATEKDFERIARSSETSIKATQESIRLEQRAWLAVWEFRILPADQKGAIRLSLDVVNTGRSPAVHIEMALTRMVLDRPSMLDEPPHVTPKLQFRSTAPIPPQGKHTMATEESVSALGNDYEGIKSGAKVLYEFGKIRYLDIFGKPHTTQICLFMAKPEDQLLSNCGSGNEMN
jgi:hypothetical protein